MFERPPEKQQPDQNTTKLGIATSTINESESETGRDTVVRMEES